MKYLEDRNVQVVKLQEDLSEVCVDFVLYRDLSLDPFEKHNVVKTFLDMLPPSFLINLLILG